MGRTLTLIAIVLSMGLITTMATGQIIKQRNPFEKDFEAPDKIEKKGDWEYRLVETNKGTRSQGQRGELFFKGKKYTGKKLGQIVKTDLGDMVFKGDEGANLWDSVGWYHHVPGQPTTTNTRLLKDMRK